MAVQSNFEKQQNVRSWCLTLLDPAWESENWPLNIVDDQLWDVICPHDSSRQLVKIMCGKIIDRYSVVKDICLSEKHNEIDKICGYFIQVYSSSYDACEKKVRP